MGRLRAENGHPQPFGIQWWAIGNEMYGDWQLGHMPLTDYVEKHKEVVDAMAATLILRTYLEIHRGRMPRRPRRGSGWAPCPP